MLRGKSNWVIITKLLVAIVFFLFCMGLWKVTIINKGFTEYISVHTGESSSEEVENIIPIELEGIRQTFFSKKPINALEFKMSKTSNARVDARIILRNATDGDILYQDNVQIENGFVKIRVNETREITKKEYELIIKPIEENKTSIGIHTTKKRTYQEGMLFVGKQQSEEDIILRAYVEEEKHKVWVLFSILITVNLMVIMFVYNSKLKIEFKYLIIAATIGMTYMMLLTPRTIPDEGIHIENAYRLSNQLMGKGYRNEDGTMNIREEDLKMYQLSSNSSLSNVMHLVDNFQVISEVNGWTTVKAQSLSTNIFPHLPAVLGITMGKILGISSYLLLYLGRLCNLAFFIAASFWGILQIPVGKKVLFVVGILPMTLHQAASYSYDAVINGLAFLIIGVGLKLLYNNQYLKIQLQKQDICLYVVALMWLGTCKSGIYIFLGAIVLPIIAAKKLNKKMIFYIGFVSLAGIIAFLIFYWNTLFSLFDQSKIMNNEYYTIPYILANPLRYGKVFLTTILKDTEFYLATMVGSMLGWMNIYVNNLVIIGYWILLLFSVIRDKEEVWKLKTSTKIILFGIGSMVFCGVELAATMWNVITQDHIGSVQGRYFLPILPIGLLMLDNQCLVYQKSREHIIILSAGILHLPVFCEIIVYAFGMII